VTGVSSQAASLLGYTQQAIAKISVSPPDSPLAWQLESPGRRADVVSAVARHRFRSTPKSTFLLARIGAQGGRLRANAECIDFTGINHHGRPRAGNHPVEQIIDPVVAQLRFAFVANAAPHAHAVEFGGDFPPGSTRHEPPLSIRPVPGVRHDQVDELGVASGSPVSQ
jgi:hypothetical protein